MSNETIKDILMRRDGMTEEEALALIVDAKAAWEEYIYEDDLESAFYVCQEFFGLEPDYIDKLIY